MVGDDLGEAGRGEGSFGGYVEGLAGVSGEAVGRGAKLDGEEEGEEDLGFACAAVGMSAMLFKDSNSMLTSPP